MSTLGWLTITCDVCPRTALIRFENDVATARRYARNRGWKQDDRGADICPRHLGRKRT